MVKRIQIYDKCSDWANCCSRGCKNSRDWGVRSRLREREAWGDMRANPGACCLFWMIFEWKNGFLQKIKAEPLAFKNKVLSLQSLIEPDDIRVAGYTNLVILSIYLKHKEKTHTNADIIRYCKTVKHLVGNAESCGKSFSPLSFFKGTVKISGEIGKRIFFRSLPDTHKNNKWIVLSSSSMSHRQ